MAKQPKLESYLISIRGRKWQLFVLTGPEWFILCKDLTPEEHKNLPYGICDSSTEQIILNADFPLQACLDTLMHEVAHAIFSIVNGSQANALGQIEEEIAANLLGYALPEYIPQHTAVVKFIKQQHKKKNK